MNSCIAQKVLIRSPNWIGDTILSMPAIEALKRAEPELDLTVMARAELADLWQMTCVERVVPFSVSRGVKGLIDRRRIALALRKQSFSTALVLPNSFDSALVPWLARIPERVGWPTDCRGMLLTRKIPYPAHLHNHSQAEVYVNLVEQWQGRPISAALQVRLRVPDSARAAVREVCGAGRTILGLNPGSTYGSAKRWLPERFADIALRAHREFNADIIIVGSAGDAVACTEVYNLVSAQDGGAQRWCQNLAGRTTLPELAAWLESCKCLLTNDTGAMHVAAAVGTPVVAIFGSTDWRTTAPLGAHHRLVTASIKCAPCLKRECPTKHECMTSIVTDQVWSEVAGLMTERTAPMP